MTRDQVDAASLEWSPDGRRFVFSTIPRTQSSSIWVMKRDGSNRRRLTPRGSWMKPSWARVWPSWSPNGRSIFFSVLAWGQPRQGIYVMNATGTNRRRLTRRHDQLLSWSPDRRRIAFVRRVLASPQALDRPELWVMNADGTHQRRLYARLGHGDRIALSPNWRKLVIERERRDGSVHELHVMNIDGSGAYRLARGGSDHAGFSWSPNSRAIAFERDNGLNRGTAIWVAAADGTWRRRLVSLGTDPLWSPDGRLIAFWQGGISVVNSDGGAPRLLVRWRGEITNVRWAPTS